VVQAISPTLGKLRQKDQEFEASLGCMASSSIAKPYLQKKKKKNSEEHK
jgi:hypothetical protein